MATPVYKHVDDDGTLSIFASEGVIVLACEHGEYWVLEAKMETKATVKPAIGNLVSADHAEFLFRAM